MGFNPTRPQQEAGMRIDPPPSEPMAKGLTPVATDAADPALEPPEVSSVFHGFRVAGKMGLCPTPL